MKEHLLQIGSFPDFVQDKIDAEFVRHDWESLQASPALLPKVRGIITRSNYLVPADTIHSLSNLGVIATCGVGYDLIPLQLAKEKGIVVANTPNVLNSAVAELAVGLTLAMLRQLPQAHNFAKTSQWPQSNFSLGTNLSGKTVGIIGLGRIGREIARRFEAFDVSLAYFGRTRQNVDLRFEPQLLKLAETSDILIIAAPGGPETAKMINADVLNALGPNGYLVNIARGSLVDEDALAEALREGVIAGAALDVFNNEPHINPQLLNLDRLILAPHIGSATHETRLAMAELTLQNLRQFYRDGSVLTPVSV
ncbi:2-hydroxyacid dehydrogenase [Pusillimonas sp. ANT_WB101]|uniref:2-hydroxyacid dehydrogenase n=1 Tax=Pusillimonas sp. ANT_WB101 TaxID=2597356 RepID=UPI0011EF938D|nr:2-hydroxyacid dehydrogenase [Pusillimonas sp. ANT_WB101]KAA0911609.1 2-hydroxyacid dehydrogenase [Pusillimonas sp. ANT_WB101]